jgi:hypothetical protein
MMAKIIMDLKFKISKRFMVKDIKTQMSFMELQEELILKKIVFMKDNFTKRKLMVMED